MDRYLNLPYLKANIDHMQKLASGSPWIFGMSFFAIYVIATAVSLPGAAILSLAADAIFDFVYGTVLVSFASTIGATCAFLASRYLLSDYVRTKFKSAVNNVDGGMAKEGNLFLFALRLVPIVPFFLWSIF